MDSYFGAPDSEILPQRMNTLYPQPQGPQQPQQPHQQQQFAVQQRDQQFQQVAKNAVQSQPGASLMAPYSQHQPGQGGMNGPSGPTSMGAPGGAMNIPGAMGGPGGPGGMGPGGPMGGAPGMNGQRIIRRPNMAPMPGGMNMATMGMRPGGMQPRMGMSAQNGMGPNQGGMLGGQGGMAGLGAQGGMPGQGNMSLGGGQGNMGGLGGQAPMGNMSNIGGGSAGMNGPGGMSMGGGPNPMSMGGGSGLAQGGIPGPGSQGNMSGLGPQPMGSQSALGGGMGGVMSMGGAGGGISNLAGGGSMSGQQGAMGGLGGLGGQGGLGSGPGNMGPGAGGPGGMGNPGGMNSMSSMNLNGMGPSGGPGMSGGNGLPGANGMPGPANRSWPPERQYTDDMTKRPASTHLDDFGGLPGAGQHGIGGVHPGGLQHGGPQHGSQQAGGGPQHGVGGPGQHGIGPQHGIGAPQQQQPPGPHAGSPVNGMPAHHPQHHPVPTHIGQGPPGHMGQAGTPRMNTTPAHPGGPQHMPTAPSPHHMGGSPAHHQGHSHQPPHHLVSSPAHQMSSPGHMHSSSPAPGPGPHPPRSGAPTPVPPRGTSADPMMGMRPDGMGRPVLAGDQGLMRMNEGMMMRGSDGQMRPTNEMMMARDGRIVRDGMLPMERAPSADSMMRPGGLRPELGRLGPDGTMVRGPMQYGQPPYGGQGAGFGQPPGPGYVLTPAQQHQNMQVRNGGGGGVQRAESVDDMPILSDQMGLPNEMGDIVSSGPTRRPSMPPQMTMTNGPGPGSRPGPGPGPGGPPMGMGMGMAQRRPTISQQQRPIPLGMGVVRMLQMSQEMSEANQKSFDQWVKFRNEYFMPDGRISMTIFQGVEGRKYDVSPELIARFFLTFFESGVAKMGISLNGAKEIVEDPGNPLDSVIKTLQGVWRYELSNGWVIEHTGPLDINMTTVADSTHVPGEPPQAKLKIQAIAFNAPLSSYLFNLERLEGNRISGQAGPMTPRISPGLAARKPEGDDPSGNGGREEEALVFENARLPPKPFQKFGFPESVWRLLAMSSAVQELFPIMELSQETQSGPLATLEHYAEIDREARMSAGLGFLPDDLGGHQFPSFASEFTNPSNMPNSSPALTHPHPGMHNPQGSMATIGRPTPTPPLPRTLNRNGQPLAGSGELPPVPGLSVGPGMMMQQSPSLAHQMPPGQANGQSGMKRKLNPPDQGQDVGGPSGASRVTNGRGVKSSPVGTRKKAKTNAQSG